MSKKDNSPAISFFSFQDIITSITGIMFLVVMMLVLMILIQPDAAQKQKEQAVSDQLKTLREEMQKLKTALDELNQRSEVQRKRIDELKKLKMETLPELKASLIEKLKAADMNMIRLMDENKRFILLRKEESTSGEKLQEKFKETADINLKLKEVLKQLEQETADYQKLSEKYQAVVKFVWNKSNPKRPILLECSDSVIIGSCLDGKFANKSFNDYNSCISWCRSFPVNDTYFILLLKPSSFSYAEKFSLALSKAGYERGREVLPNDQTMLFKEPVK